jgi:hypothetical protein
MTQRKSVKGNCHMRTETNQTRDITDAEIQFYMNCGRAMRSAAVADMFRATVRTVFGWVKSAKPAAAPKAAEAA